MGDENPYLSKEETLQRRQERAERIRQRKIDRLNKDIKREQGRGKISERTRQRIIELDLDAWIKKTIESKSSSSDSVNTATTQIQSKAVPKVQTSEPTSVNKDIISGGFVGGGAGRGTNSAIQYYNEGAGTGVSGSCPLGLYVVSDEGDPPTYSVWVNAGTIAGEQPSEWGADPFNGLSIATGTGNGTVYAVVQVDQEVGVVTSASVTFGSSVPEDTDTTYHYALGFFSVTASGANVNSYGCGNVEANICRNWFAAETPFFGVSLTRCGCSSTS